VWPIDTPRAPAVKTAEEPELLAALALGERAAAEALVSATYRRVFALQCRLTGGDRDLAGDLTQETYRRAWAALASFDRRARFSTWLYRIATNVFLNHVRRPHLVVPLEDEQRAAIADRGPRQDEEAEAAQRREMLRRAVLALPETLRTTVVLRFWAESRVADIARAEGISGVAVRKRLRRALALLAHALEETP
jgi:RNA polymerase sigma-70 factor (ECF subfamily)